jgi:glucose-6-phosphate isomerase
MALVQNLHDGWGALGHQPQPLTAAHTAAIAKFIVDAKAGEHPGFGPAFTPLTLNLPLAHALQPWPERFTDVLLLGLGSASYGAQMLRQWANPSGTGARVRLHTLDHLCPATFDELLRTLDLNTTGVIGVSKSGTTLETVTMLGVITEAFASRNIAIGERLCVITEDGPSNPMAQFAKVHKATFIAHHPKVNGRFSAFYETLQTPCALLGLDADALLAGGREVWEAFIANPFDSAPVAAAQLHLAAAKPMHLVYTYGGPLRQFNLWFDSLWAECLGKTTAQGSSGAMPLGANGPSSQHSIQQMLLGGVRDKVITLIIPHTRNNGVAAALNGVSQPAMGTIQEAMAWGTHRALVEHGHTIRTFTLDDRSPRDLGALCMHMLIETVVTALLLEIDPFTQPDVAKSKAATLDILNAWR